MTPPLQFSHASTVYSTIPTHKLVFSFVLDDSSVRTKDILKDPIDTSEDTKIRIFVLPPFPHYFIMGPDQVAYFITYFFGPQAHRPEKSFLLGQVLDRALKLNFPHKNLCPILNLVKL